MARNQHPFCKSSRIHENEIARLHAKAVSRSESINLNSSERECQKNEGKSKQQGAPQLLTDGYYY